jgi:hypothetical protein
MRPDEATSLCVNDEEAITRLCGSVVPDRSGFRFAEDRVMDGDRSFLDVLRESDGPTNTGPHTVPRQKQSSPRLRPSSTRSPATRSRLAGMTPEAGWVSSGFRLDLFARHASARLWPVLYEA